MFCSIIQFSLCSKALLSEEKKARESTKEDSGEGGSESKESKSAELWPAFEIENFSLHYIRASGNYQKDKGGRACSAHIYGRDGHKLLEVGSVMERASRS